MLDPNGGFDHRRASGRVEMEPPFQQGKVTFLPIVVRGEPARSRGPRRVAVYGVVTVFVAHCHHSAVKHHQESILVIARPICTRPGCHCRHALLHCRFRCRASRGASAAAMFAPIGRHHALSFAPLIETTGGCAKEVTAMLVTVEAPLVQHILFSLPMLVTG